MPLRSMTGFGRSTRRTERGEYVVEIRSLNSRFLDVNLRMPPGLAWAEPGLRQIMQKSLARGKVDAWFQWEPAGEIAPAPRICVPVLIRLIEDAQEVRRRKPGIAAPKLGDYFRIPGVVEEPSRAELSPELSGAVFADLEAALRDALGQLITVREREGAALAESLRERRKTLGASLEAIRQSRQSVVERYRERLRQRIAELLKGSDAPIDAGRLELEVALLADKADIHEEVDRLTAHLAALDGAIAGESKESAGRALDFLAQELLREANTIGSKVRELDIAQQVLAMKGAIESIKEQVLNIE